MELLNAGALHAYVEGRAMNTLRYYLLTVQ